MVVGGPLQCGGLTRQVRALGSPRSAFCFILYSFGYPELGPDMTTEGRKAASIPEVTWLRLLAQKHTVLSPDLQMHFKRLPNETKAKQLRALQTSVWSWSGGRTKAVLASEGGWELPGWPKMLWVHGDPVNLHTHRISPRLH